MQWALLFCSAVVGFLAYPAMRLLMRSRTGSPAAPSTPAPTPVAPTSSSTPPAPRPDTAADAFYRQMAENIPGAVLRYILHTDGTDSVDYMSPGCYAIWELDAASIAKSTAGIWQATHRDDVERLQNSVRQSGATLTPWSQTWRITTPSGKPKWLQGFGRPLRHANGDTAWNTAIFDVTATKLIEDSLRETETRFRTLIEDLEVGVVLQDAEDRILLNNPASTRLLGLTQDQLIGVTARDPRWKLAREDGSDFPFDQVPSVLAARTRQPVRNTIIGSVNLQTGLRTWFQVNATPRLKADGSLLHVLVTLVDITERKNAEDRKHALEAQLAQAQKMEAIGRLAGGIAHDFNNLLTVIAGYCNMLQGAALPEEQRTMIQGITNASDHAAALTRQLLTFSRREIVEPKVMNLNTVVAETEGMLQRVIGEDVKLITILDPKLARVNVDPGNISQVIMNLAVNARDAMPTGGTLTIETHNVTVDHAIASAHRGANSGPYVVLNISDTGCGMSADVQARIFEPFFTTKEAGKGTGLGLATVHAIAQRSGGFLSVYSEPGRGSTFKLYLPAVDPAPKPTPAPAASSASTSTSAPQGSETILLVEDEPAVRALTTLMLRQLGYNVIQAPSGPAALAAAADHPDSIDLLVTDVVMPEMGGSELVEQLSRIRPGLKSLYLSGYTDDAIVRHGVLHADVAFLQKPFTFDGLARKVRQTIDAPPATPRST